VSLAIITGSAGLIGSEAATFFSRLGFDMIGIDNDLRRVFFGIDASTLWNRTRLQNVIGNQYKHVDADIRDREAI
jgi:CDP-paratose 2-epimerase